MVQADRLEAKMDPGKNSPNTSGPVVEKDFDLVLNDEDIDFILAKEEEEPTPQVDLDLVLNDEDIAFILAKEEEEPIPQDDIVLVLNDEDIDFILAIDEELPVPQADLDLVLNDEDIAFILATEEEPVPQDDLDLVLNDEDIDFILGKDEELVPAADLVTEENDSLLDQETDTDSDEEPQEPAKIKLEIGRFHDLPRSIIPEEAFEDRGVHCQVLGVDTYGFVFIGFPQQTYETVHMDAMSQLNHIYRNIDLRALAVEQEQIETGEILVGKIITKVQGEPVQIFLRVQVVDIDTRREMIMAVDIDDQKLHKFHIRELYWMIEHFFKIPMRGVKCRLAGLEEFLGTPIISEAIRSCQSSNYKMVVKVTESEDIDIKLRDFPKVQLFQSEWELETGEWSFNRDLIEVIAAWNKDPFEFTSDMVLLETRVTHANTSGQVWVQFQSSIMNELADLRPQEDLSHVNADHILNTVKALRKIGKEMFVKKVDGRFRRVIVSPNSRQRSYSGSKKYRHPRKFGEGLDTVELTHADYGTVEIGHLRQLLPFSYFSDILERVPPQGFNANLQQKVRGCMLSPEDIDLLTSTGDVKIVFDDTPNNYVPPTITVYFPKKEHPKPYHPGQLTMEGPERPESQCSSGSSGKSSSNFSFSSDPRKKLLYRRYLIPIETRFVKRPGRQFEYDYDHKWLRARHTHHVAIFDYSSTY